MAGDVSFYDGFVVEQEGAGHLEGVALDLALDVTARERSEAPEHRPGREGRADRALDRYNLDC